MILEYKSQQMLQQKINKRATEEMQVIANAKQMLLNAEACVASVWENKIQPKREQEPDPPLKGLFSQ